MSGLSFLSSMSHALNSYKSAEDIAIAFELAESFLYALRVNDQLHSTTMRLTRPR